MGAISRRLALSCDRTDTKLPYRGKYKVRSHHSKCLTVIQIRAKKGERSPRQYVTLPISCPMVAVVLVSSGSLISAIGLVEALARSH